MIHDELVRLLAPTIEHLGYALWGCEYLSQGRHSLLRIYIDKPDGIGIDDCQKVSHAVSALLDVEDPIPGNYHLEVSSPGIPRPLFSNWQYLRYLGKTVHLKTLTPVQGKRKWSGTLVSASENALILEADGVQQEILFSTIVKAHVAV